MLRRWNRLIAFILAFALVLTTFNSDIANIRVFAEGNPEESLDAPAEPASTPAADETAPAADPEPEPDPIPNPEPTPEESAPAADPAPDDPTPAPEDPAAPTDPTPADPVNPAPVDPAADPSLTPEIVDTLTIEELAANLTLEEVEKPKEEEEAPAKKRGASEITIHYVAAENGTVSRESENIGETGEALGSTAEGDEGYTIDNWKDENGVVVCEEATFVPSGEQIFNGATYTAYFKNIEVAPEVTTEYTVIFWVDGVEYRKTIYTDGDNELTIPERPFKPGYFFTGWTWNGSSVSDGMTVEQDMSIEAQFQEIRLFNLTVEYYYINPTDGTDFVFDSSVKTVEKGGFPVSFNSPTNVSVSSDEEHPVYYPSQELVTFTESDVDYTQEATLVDGIATLNVTAKRVQYIPYNFFYTVEYYLKNLDGNGYTLKKSLTFEGTVGQMVTPEIITVDGWVFERTQSAEITEEGTTIPVYYTRANFTLHYDSQGGSYIDAVSAPFESVISVSETKPTKLGYKFMGWYLDEDLTQAAGNSVQLTKDTTIYAKWQAQDVDYTILYLVENANDDGFTFQGSKTKKAPAGSTVEVTASDEKPSGILDSPVDYEFKDSESAVVKADGSTVIKVRYSRKVYTIEWNGDVYNTSGGRRATGQGSASVTAKYGANITQAFTDNFNAVYPDYAWSFTTKNDDKFVNIDTMPSYSAQDSPKKGTGHNVNAFDFSTTKKQNLNYWLENYAGSKTVTRNGRTYGLYKTQTVKFNFLYDYSEFYEIDGYTKDTYTATYTDRWGRTQNYSLGSGTPNAELDVHFYYNAKTYTLAFYDYHGALLHSYQVKLNQDITGYMQNESVTAPVDSAQWLGWYTDPEHAAAYSGNGLMPEGLALYANWQLPSFTITFKDGNTTIQTDTYEYMQQAESISLSDKVGYTFGGWFTNESYTQAYDFAKPMTANVTVYAKWVPKTLSYTVRYVDADTQENVADPKVVISPVFKKGDTVTEDSIIVAGRIADATSKSIVLDYEDNEIVFEYSTRQGTLTYTVKYVLKSDHSVQVHAPKTKTVSSTYLSITEAAASVDKAYMQENYPAYAEDDYYPEQDVISYNLSAGTNEIIFEYNSYASGRVIVHYRDMAGNPIPGKADVEAVGKAGDTYSIDTSVNGYTFKKVTNAGGATVSSSVVFRDGTVERFVYLQKNLTIRAKNKTKAYDGTALYSEGTGDVVVEGLADGHTLSAISYTGSQTEGGSSPTTPHDAVIAGATEDYYNITYIEGTLTVTKKSVRVTIVGDKISKTYDGNTYTAEYRVTNISDSSFLQDYIQFNGSAQSVSRKHVGKDNLVLNNMFSVKPEYQSSFNVTFNVTDGYVEIKQRKLTVWTETLSKKYDGTPLKSEDIEGETWRITGLADGENLVFGGFENEITNVGTVNNDVILDWANPNTTAIESDYIYDWQNGTLTIEEASVKITVTGAKKTVNYNGQEQSVYGFEVTANNTAYKVATDLTVPAQDNVIAKGTNVGTYPLKQNQSKFVNNNANFVATFEFIDGELEIIGSEKVKVKIKGNKDEITYDGASHSVTGYTVSITNPEGITPYTEADFTFNGTAVAAGTDASETPYKMNLKASDFTNNNSNYNVEFEIEEDGQLIINPREVTVTITGHTDSKVYNGQEQTVTGYEVNSNYEGYTEADFTYNGTAVAAGTYVSETAYAMGLTAADFSNNDNNNYTVTFNVTDGSLTITKRPVTVAITGHTDTKVYNGSIQTVEGYEYDIRDSIYTEADFNGPAQSAAVAAGKDVSETAYAMGLTAGAFSNGNDNFDVTFDVEDGWLKITPVTDKITIKVIGNKKSVPFNNEVQEVRGITTQEPILEGITLQYDENKAVASGKDVGEYAMGLKAEDFTAVSDNYSNIEIVVDDGKLTITPGTRPDNTLPTVTGYSGVYDAQSHTITIEGGLEDDTYTYEVGGATMTVKPSATHVEESVARIIVTVKNPNYVDQEIGTVAIEITPKGLEVTTSGATKEYDGTPLTNPEAFATGFIPGESATVVGTGTITDVGDTDNTYKITWDNAKESDYSVSETLKKLIITQSTKEITFTAPGDTKIYDGTPLTADGSGDKKITVTGLPEGYRAEAIATGSQTDAGSSANVVTTAKIFKGNDDVTDNFGNIKTVDGTLKVTPKAATITTGPASKIYDGTALTCDVVNIDGLVEGESVVLEATGSITEVGSADNTYSIVWDHAKEANYTVTKVLGTLTVSPIADAVLTAGSATKVYDGTPLTEASVTEDGLPSGYKAVVEISGSQTKAGESANTIVSHKIYDANNVDRTRNFENVTYVDGTLTVTPAPVTIKTGSASKPYDGTKLTADEANITGLIAEEAGQVTVKAKGEVTDVTVNGPVDNDYEINWGTVNPDNYAVTDDLGTLEITPNTTTIYITAKSDTKVYDGEALTNNEIELSGLPGGLSVESSNTGTITEVGETENKVETYKILDKDNNDVTAFFPNIEVGTGTLKVTVRPVIVKIAGKTDSKKYDGDEHVVEGYDITSIETPDETPDTLYKQDYFTFSGTARAARTIEGQTKMGLTADNFANDNTNFDVLFKVTDGYMEILPLGEDEKFVINASTPSFTFVYDGQEHGGFDYSVTSGSGRRTFLQTLSDLFSGVIGSVVRPIIGKAADGTKEVTINGKTYKISGLSVNTSGKDVGTYPLPISGTMVVTDENNNDVSGMFKLVVTETGTLEITARPITVESGSASKTYDGTALTNPEITITGSWADGEGATVTATGSQTLAGWTYNTIEIIPDDGTKLSNYDITRIMGTLTVTDAPVIPTPGGGGDPDPVTPDPTVPDPGVVTIVDDVAPLAATPVAPTDLEGAVLGARRVAEGQVLGARRARTADDTNAPARLFAIIIAGAVAAYLLLTRKKEDEQE